MNNKKHHISHSLLSILLLLLLIGGSNRLRAQNSTSNPFSMFGLGELRTQSNVVSSGMGNAGIGVSSGDYLNTLNPASYNGIDSLHFLMNIAVDAKFSNFSSEGKSQRLNDTNFSYLALGWRINDRLAMGFGINPYSSTGYEVNYTDNVGGTSDNYSLTISGSGDISRVYTGVSYRLLPNLSIGGKVSYLFGKMIQTQFHDLSTVYGTAIYNQMTDYFRNFYFEFGAQYTLSLKNNKTLTLGIIYNPRQILVTQHKYLIYDASGNTMASDNTNKSEFQVPEEYGAGFSLDNHRNLIVALDAGIQFWSNEKYDLTTVRLKDSPYLRGGLQYTPSTHFLDPYFKRVQYRVGGQYGKSYLKLRDKQLSQYSGSFGVGLPLRRGASRLDISFEYGQLGTLSNRLIRQRYLGVRFGLALQDLWFVQRKYD